MIEESAFHLDLTETFPHLPGAPIVEAVIHWRARATQPFSREQLQKELAKRFPEYPECQPQHELQLEALFAANGSSTQIRRDTWQGFRLTSPDKRHIVQFTRDGIVFSRLAPYRDWESFSAEALRLWTSFVELAQPPEIQRLGVRFINRIPTLDVGRVKQYMARPPKSLEPLGLPMSGFLYQSIHEVPGQPFHVRVVQTVQPPTPPQDKEFGLILDIDVFTVQALQIEGATLRGYLERMRWLKNKAFFSLVSRRAVERFKKGGNGDGLTSARV